MEDKFRIFYERYVNILPDGVKPHLIVEALPIFTFMTTFPVKLSLLFVLTIFPPNNDSYLIALMLSILFGTVIVRTYLAVVTHPKHFDEQYEDGQILPMPNWIDETTEGQYF